MPAGKRTFNIKSVLKKVASSKTAQRKIDKAVQKKIEREKKNTLKEFDAHPITVELQNGPQATNSSGTLGGYGNLFSFIGFSAGSNPTTPLRSLIQSAIAMRRRRVQTKKKGIKFVYMVTLPSEGQINAVTPMPWEGGSWAEAMENGMSNFSYYMYKRFGDGRSGWGFQADHNLRNAIFKPKAYVTEILNNFKTNIKKK